MPKRSTSKKRAAELEKEIDMENKEATPVEGMKIRLPPAEPNQPALKEKQLEKSNTKEDTKMDKMMEIFLREFKSMKEELCQKMDDSHRRLMEK